MLGPLVQALAILMLLPIGHFLGRPSRLMLFAVGGAVFLLAMTPMTFWIVLVTIIEALVLERVLRPLARNSLWRQYVPYILLPNLFATDILNAHPNLDLTTAGLAFAVVRVFMTTKQLLSAQPAPLRHRVAPLVLGGYYLPVLAVGPIVSGVALWNQRTGEEPPRSTELMYRMMFGGWILAALVSPWMLDLAGGTGGGGPVWPLKWLALFGYLFAAFWGQSLIAEHGSALAGFTVPQNFDKPWLARDFKEFWNRWHISMARFVMQYIFLPLNLRGVSPKIATVASFLFMGLWHEVKPGYIIWGLAHGILIAYAPTTPADAPLLRRSAARLVTLSTVVALSYLANYGF